MEQLVGEIERSGSRQLLADPGDVWVGGVAPGPSRPVISVLADDEQGVGPSLVLLLNELDLDAPGCPGSIRELRSEKVNVDGLHPDDHVIGADHHVRGDSAATQHVHLPGNLGRLANLGLD
jgi:hypothetical protein